MWSICLCRRQAGSSFCVERSQIGRCGGSWLVPKLTLRSTSVMGILRQLTEAQSGAALRWNSFRIATNRKWNLTDNFCLTRHSSATDSVHLYITGRLCRAESSPCRAGRELGFHLTRKEFDPAPDRDGLKARFRDAHSRDCCARL